MRATAVVLFIAASAAAWFLWPRPASEPVSTEPVPTVVEPAAPERLEEPSGSVAEPVARAPGGADCLTLAEFERHPAVTEETRRLEPISASGETVASYRHLGSAEIRAMADQGDSAAMAVLGAMAFMRGSDIDESRAVPFLLHEELPRPGGAPGSANAIQRMHFVEAGSWFYQAALRGRLHALTHYGISLEMQGSTPVTLGWIGQDAYDALAEVERLALEPSVVYTALQFDIAPQLLTGLYGRVASDAWPPSDRQLAIRQSLLVDFYRSVDQAGLPPISVPEADTLDFEDLRSLLCESEQGY